MKERRSAEINLTDRAAQALAAASGLTIAELEEALQRLLIGQPFTDALAERLAAERARPRYARKLPRPDVVTYRIRVDLRGTKPPLWRRLELASDLTLAQVHEALQAAFGWYDCHLHEFWAGPECYGSEAESYLCPFESEEGADGVPEEHVRLDEVLAAVGDKLSYAYDFGDDWRHVLKLEQILPREPGAPRAACTGGRRAGPPENSGGVYAYEVMCAATDPDSPDHAYAVADFERHFGNDPDPGLRHTSPFDRDEINDLLADRLG